MTPRTIVGIGEILWDIFPDHKTLGGAPTNFAYHCQLLGHEAYSVSAIGSDELGAEIERRLAELPLQRILQRRQEPTGTVAVTLNAKGSPSYTITEEVAWDNLLFTEELRALAERTDAVCFGSLAQRSPQSRHAIREFLRATPATCVRVFDVNLRQGYYDEPTLRSSLKLATLLKLNDEEVPILGEVLGLTGSLERIARQLLDTFELQGVILTRGAEGSHCYLREGSVYYPSIQVSVADTVGAGDAFTAGFVSAYLAGKSPVACMTLATHVAAHVCAHQGAMPSHPEEFRAYLV